METAMEYNGTNNTATNGASTNRELGNNIVIEYTRPKKHIGLFGAIAFGMGSMIGSGIFISPTGTLKFAGSIGLSLCVWVFGGLISLLNGLVYAELGSMIPQSGGDFNYIRKGLNSELLGFQAVWCMPLFSHTSATAVLGIVFADYFLILLFGSCKPPWILNRLIAFTLILTICILNTYSAKLGAFIQRISTVSKILSLSTIIVGGLVFIVQGEVDHFTNSFEGTATNMQAVSLSIYSCIFAYGGYTRIGEVADEIINPRKNIPRAVIISIACVTALYVLTNVSYFTLLTKQEFVTSSAVAYDWALKCINPAAFLITVSVLISVSGAMNGSSFAMSRMMFSAARAGHFPEVLSYLNITSSVPVVSLVVYHLLVLPFLFGPGDVFTLINFLSYVAILISMLTSFSLLRFRYIRRNQKKEDDLYQSPLFVPIANICVALFLLILPFVTNPRLEFVYAVGIILAGVIVYFIFVRFGVKIPGIDKATCWLQLLCNIGPTVKLD